MASKKSKKAKAGAAVAAPETTVSARTPVAPVVSLSAVTPPTTTRLPHQKSPEDLAAARAEANKGKNRQGEKTKFLLAMLTEAGTKGITWADMQDRLRARFGSAPEKRRSFYVLLEGVVHHRTTEAKGVKRYFLGTRPEKAPVANA